MAPQSENDPNALSEDYVIRLYPDRTPSLNNRLQYDRGTRWYRIEVWLRETRFGIGAGAVRDVRGSAFDLPPSRMHLRVSPKVYQYIWLPAAFLPLGLAPYNIYLLFLEPTTSFLDAVPNLIFFVLSK